MINKKGCMKKVEWGGKVGGCPYQESYSLAYFQYISHSK